ncbi:MAG: HAMP domain-containing sensor histidine kinase [bacterium]
MDGEKQIKDKAILFFSIILVSELVIFFVTNIFALLISVVVTAVSFWYFWQDSLKREKIKNQFIEIVTHRFRTPISIIGWSVDALETEIDITQRREEVKRIRNSLEKIQEVVGTLVGVTQVNERVFYHFEQVNFRILIEEVLAGNFKKRMEEKGIIFTLNVPVSLPYIYADNKRIKFVLKNLIENAILYTPRGGYVELGVKENEDSIVFSVTDTGIGIDKDGLRDVFSGFYRSKEAKLSDTEGMGLGLYVSKKIIENHHGRIWAESDGVGKGSTFFVEFKIDQYKQII